MKKIGKQAEELNFLKININGKEEKIFHQKVMIGKKLRKIM